jgi:hypothetical protein
MEPHLVRIAESGQEGNQSTDKTASEKRNLDSSS